MGKTVFPAKGELPCDAPLAMSLKIASGPAFRLGCEALQRGRSPTNGKNPNKLGPFMQTMTGVRGGSGL